MPSPNVTQDVASQTETKLGLPSGVLVAVSQHPVDITPKDKKEAIEKYGVDPTLSPENEAEVIGLKLKDSLARNKGNVAAAVGELHGGPDPSAWNAKTRSYINKVMVAHKQVTALPANANTFQKALANVKATMKVTPDQIAPVYQAYKEGKMTPEEASQFEADVKSGLVMLPQGATLAGQTPTAPTAKPEPKLLPQSVTEAYVGGQMTDQEKADLEADMKAGLVKLPPSTSSMIPTGEPNQQVPTEQGVMPTPREPSLGERLTGAGEAALATVTGATGGMVGMAGGAVKGITQALMDGSFGTQEAANMVARQAGEGAQALTYQPRTATGREYTENVGEFMEPLTAVAPMANELSMVSEAARASMPMVETTMRAAAKPVVAGAGRAAEMAQSGAMKTVEAVKNAPGRAMEMIGMREPSTISPASIPPSVGAAGVPVDVQRAAKASNLPVPISLTKGAETRDAAQLAFEKEQMKGPLGAPLRARAEENNLQALGNFDTLVDLTGAEAPDLSATGNKVVQSLSEGYKAAKNKTNVAYTKARKSPESSSPVDPNTTVMIGEGDNAIQDSLIGYLNSKVSGVPSAAVTDTARKLLVKMGLAKEDETGNLVGLPATVGKMEDFRRELAGTASWDDRVGIREETILKKIVDAQTEPVSGPLYKEARALRQQQARKYENRSVVARLITNRKGMEDPKVAVDQVFHKSILSGSPEEITFLKRVLTTSGEDGVQAWKELQGATLSHIRDEATKGMGMDSADNPLISPAKLHQAVTALDKNGRLDIVLGKKQAEIVRSLNEVVRYVNTVPPGTLINNSGTTGTMLAAIAEAGATGALTGLPVPAISALRALSKHITDTKVKARINAALNAKPVKSGE